MEENSDVGKRIGTIIGIVGGTLIIVFCLVVFVVIPLNDNFFNNKEEDSQTRFQCVHASPEQMAQLSAFIHGNYRLENGYITEKDDGYYVAAGIFERGGVDNHGVGVWYVFGPKDDPRSVLRVGSTAKTATPLLSAASTTNFDLSYYDDEAQFAEECADIY